MTDTFDGTTIARIITSRPRLGPNKMALGQLIAELGTLYMAPHGCADFPDSTPTPDDWEAQAEFIRKVALMAGRFLHKIGVQVEANALCRIERKWFAADTFIEVVDGWATDQIIRAARAAEDAIDEAREVGDRAWNERRA